jgi:serine/threonine protein kinase
MADEGSEMIWQYKPSGVHKVIATGSTCFVGDLGNNRVLKYPHIATDREAIEHEAQIYRILSSHPRILQCHGLDKSGLRLEKAANGTLRDFLHTQRSPLEKLKWARQLAEAVEYIHTKQVFHCDISPRNCFITGESDLKLGDFQGRFQASDGTLHEGLSAEGSKAYLPRQPGTADRYSDLFAVGSAIYEIMTGHEPYEHLDSIDDMEEIEALIAAGKFPSTTNILAGNVIGGCWRQEYDSAKQCAKDVAAIEAEQVISF